MRWPERNPCVVRAAFGGRAKRRRSDRASPSRLTAPRLGATLAGAGSARTRLGSHPDLACRSETRRGVMALESGGFASEVDSAREADPGLTRRGVLARGA